MTVAADAIRQAMSPSPVTVMTTIDRTGRRWGFTGSALFSLSVRPPLVMVAVDKAASTHSAFVTSKRFMVNVLSHHQDDVAGRFAQSNVDRFCAGDMTPCEHGLPGLEDAAARLSCTTHAVRDGGDHSMVVGVVDSAHMGSGEPPLLHHDPRFGDLNPRMATTR